MVNRPMQRSREAQPVSDDTLAKYTAARAFLAGEWAGALLMATSFLFLYAVGLSGRLGVAWTFVWALAMLALGTFMYWRNRGYYQDLGFPMRPRWHAAALIVAGSGVVGWLLVALAFVLVWFGVELL